MRQGPHNKNRSRSRGRRPTGGGGGNQSGRVYESNGPDVKVRGTAQTVADKYMQLARDAHSAGDTVMAEGYFQHAEHYLRIVAANQPVPQQNTPQRRDDYGYDDDEGDDDQPTQRSGGNGEAHRQPQQQQFQPQPEPEQPKPSTSHADDDGGNGEQPAPQSGSGQDGEQPWGGPEPEFLRRGPAANGPASNGPAANGAGRTRRPRQPRSGNGRSEAKPESDDGGSTPDSSGQDTTEQA